ncbi:MAG: hypothetical protein EBX37_10595, partial [Alphaproteobacteria bacterium]|nr:hypothetical protein [Alphaproteobacteria bacterium]
MSVAISRAVETILPAEVLAADPVARARALVPHIAAAGPRIEATRELPPELLAMLHEARMFRTLMPILLAFSSAFAAAQTPNETPANTPSASQPVPADPPAQPPGTLERLIYVPFRELQKVFNNPDASVVLPYSEYLQLLKQAMQTVPQTTANEDAVITSSNWSAVVEKDIVRITAELQVTVLKQEGWAALPVAFG